MAASNHGNSGREPTDSTMGATQLSEVAGSIYAPLITDQLDQERARKAAIEDRALSIAHVSTGFLTLFVAISTGVRGSTSPAALISVAFVPFAVAVMLFVLTAVIGIIAYSIGNSVRAYAEVPDDSLEAWIKDWDSPDLARAAKQAATAQLHSLIRARDQNSNKRRLGRWAVACEVAAVVALAFAAGLILMSPASAVTAVPPATPTVQAP